MRNEGGYTLKDNKRVLEKIICQHICLPKWNLLIPWKTESEKTHTRRNKKSD